MTPIVSPWFIYFLGVIDGVKDFLEVIAILSGVGLLAGTIGYCVSKFDDNFKEWQEFWHKFLKKFILAFCICLPLALLAPSRNTIIAMYVTKFITTDSVAKAIEASGEFKDVIKGDIIDIIEAMKGEKQEQK